MKSDSLPSLIAFANDAPIVSHQDALNLPGSIGLANESRFNSAYFSEALTTYAQGYRDTEDILGTVDFIAPPIQVARRFDWKKPEAAADFYSDLDDERAIGGAFKKVEYTGASQNGKTRNRGLCVRLDKDEIGGVIDEEIATSRLIKRIFRSKLRRAVAGFLAATAGTAKVWNAASNPDKDMRDAVAAAQLAAGVFPNRAIIGLPSWNLRSDAYGAQNNAAAYALMGKSPREVAQSLGLDDLRLSRELFQISGNGKQRIVDSQVFIFYGQDGAAKEDPTTAKQFWTPVEGGGRYRVYREEIGPKFIDITVEHYDEIIITAPLGLTRLNVTAA